MTTETVLLVYLLFFGIEFIVEGGLSVINLLYLRSKKAAPPPFVLSLYSSDEFENSVRYTMEKGILGIIKTALRSLFVLVIIFSGILGRIDNMALINELPVMMHSIVYIYIISVLFYLLDLIFEVYADFVLEKKYEFSTITVKTWIVDQIKSMVFSLIIGTVLLFTLFNFMAAAGTFWWLYSFAFIVIVQIIFLYVYPVLIAPIFNKFTRLEEGPLRSKLIALAERTSFPLNDIMVMDASRRSKHSNAYFTGFGKNKRIVLFDTLLTQLSEEEIVSVLAHEIGHYKKHHAIQSLIISMTLLLLVFLVMNMLMTVNELYFAFGFSTVSYQALLTLLLYFSSPFLFFLTPAFSFMSRKNEYQADRFVVESVGTSKWIVSSLAKLAVKNLSNLIPHPWYSAFHYSHPTLEERIKKAEEYDRQTNDRGTV